MPVSRYSDRELWARAVEIHEATLLAYEAEQGRTLTPEQVKVLMKNRRQNATVAVTEVLVRGQFVYVVTANDSLGYNVLKRNPRLLRSYEMLGDINTNLYPNLTAEEKREAKLQGQRGRAERMPMHAEQLGAWTARRLRGWAVRVATSWEVCDVCQEFFRSYFPHVRLIDSTRVPPPTPKRLTGEGPLQSGSSTVPTVRGAAFSPGQRATAGLVLVIQGASYFLERYLIARESARLQQAIRQKEPFISDYRERNPTIGLLVHIYSQNGNFSKPLEFSYGSTRREAAAAYQSARTGEANAIWVPPITPPPLSYYQPPFARVALATFQNTMVFQDVEFKFLGGFDDDGESIPLFSPRSFTARFWILKPPREVTIFYEGRWHAKDVDVVTGRIASGHLLECIGLDSVGSASALMVFPADEATAAWFSRVPRTSDRFGVLRRYDLERVRWVAPEKARLLAISG